MGDCCTHARPNVQKNKYWIYNETSRECYLYASEDYHMRYCNNSGTVMGVYQRPPPYEYCECERVFKSVGREDLVKTFTKIGGWRMFPAGGEWQSFPEAGQCKLNETLGTNGCTYKLRGITKAIKSYCMY